MEIESQLTVTTRPWTHGTVLRAEGELDHDSAAPMREALEAALAAPAPHIVVDCSGLGFCDSTGLNLLLRARLTAERAGGRIALAGPSPVVRRMLEITGALDVFHVVASVEEATGPGDGRSGGE
jgi:anti-anti-sigma factor